MSKAYNVQPRKAFAFQKIFVINRVSRKDRRDEASLAAAFTGLEIEFINAAASIDPKAWPPRDKGLNISKGDASNWRSHVDALSRIVEQDISSALILEDDADWDIRIKSQMHDFAKASRLLVQPKAGTEDRFLDPTWPRPSLNDGHTDFYIDQISTTEPTTSPYGDVDRWGMLWLGHCGTRFPKASDGNVPLGRAVISDDSTVPQRSLMSIEFGDAQLLEQYEDYTRVVSRSRVTSCMLAYAVSQAGARHLLYELGVHKVSGTTDMMFRSVCDGVDGRELLTCLSPKPALFNHHRPAGPRSRWSDITDWGEGWNDVSESMNIRWATRVNLPKLITGKTDYIDPFA